LSFRRRFGTAFVPIAAALAFAGAHLLYQLGLLMTNQAGVVRTAGVLAVAGLAIAVLAALLAAAAVRLDLDRLPDGIRRALRLAFAVGAVGSLINLGLCVYFWSPKLAPLPWQLAAVAGLLIIAFRFWRQTAEEQDMVVKALSRLGLAALVLPWLAAPWVLHGLATNPGRVAQSPLPLDGAAVKPDAPERIVLVTFDALRARSTSLGKPGSRQTPTLEAIAREATWFSDCRTTGEHTIFATSSMLTGVAPRHIFPKVGNRLGYVREGALTGLPAHLAAAGYQAYYATMLLDPSVLGIAHEFDGGVYHARGMMPSDFNTQAYLPLGEAWDWLAKKATGRQQQEVFEQQRLRAARKTVDQAREQLKAATGKTFMWVHLGVPHDQYYSVPPVADNGVDLDPSKAERADLIRISPGNRAQLTRAERIYEDYVKFGDGELGRLVRGLKADGLWDDTMLVIASDHGEEFRLDGAGHGFGTLSEDVTHVPLLIKQARQREARRDSGAASLLDVTPTVLSAVYERLPGAFEGVSLLQGAPARGARTRFTYGLLREGGMDQPRPDRYAAFRYPYKYMLDLSSGRETLYHLPDDPQAVRDVADRHAPALRQLRQEVREQLESTS
jgi:arylsulfatase A-like enzyme